MPALNNALTTPLSENLKPPLRAVRQQEVGAIDDSHREDCLKERFRLSD